MANQQIPWARPLFRWAGSKKKLLPSLQQRLPSSYCRYIEPFAGSACLFFSVNPHAAVLSDFNEELIQAYVGIRSHPRLVARAAARLPNTTEEYYRLRACDPETLNVIDRSARFVYLNRYSFNGVYRTNRSGWFNVPRGKHTGAIPDEREFVRCSLALRNAELLPTDFQRTVDLSRSGDFLYVDPPYSLTIRHRGEYGYPAFRLQDLERLVEALSRANSRGVNILLSYSDHAYVREAFKGWSLHPLEVHRHVSGFAKSRVNAKEILVMNYDPSESGK